MKYTALASERQRQILWDPRQPVSQEPNNKVIHVVRRLLAGETVETEVEGQHRNRSRGKVKLAVGARFKGPERMGQSCYLRKEAAKSAMK